MLHLVDFSEIIRIKIRIAHHRDYPTGLWVHDEDRSFIGPEFFDTRCEDLCDFLLDVAIDGEGDV